MKSEAVLLYNFNDKEKNRKLKAVLIQMGVRIKTADPSMLNEKVGFLLGIKGYEKNESPEETGDCPEELLLMKGFTDMRLNLLLANMRKAKIPKILYKAVLTPTNQGWTLKQLYEEIKSEHHEMSETKAAPTE